MDDAKLTRISNDPPTAFYLLRGLVEENMRLRAALLKAQGHQPSSQLQLEIVEKWLEGEEQTAAAAEEQRRKDFGRSSEKSEQGKDGQKKNPRSRVKHPDSGRQELPNNLPIQEEIFEIPADQRVCSENHKLHPMPNQFETVKEVEFIQPKLVIRYIKRQKYSCTQCATITTAAGPTRLVDGGQYGINFALEVVTKKYADHLPLNRIRNAFSRDGFHVAVSTLWRLTSQVAWLLDGIYEKIRESVSQSHVKHADETRWRVLSDVKNKTQYVWVFRDRYHAYFTIEDSRGSDIPLWVLRDTFGALVADDWGAYRKVVEERHLIRVQCWAHARRKFFDLLARYPDQIDVILDMVKRLYLADDAFHALGTRLAEDRKRLCGPIIEEIDHWRKTQHVMPRSDFGGALKYLNNCWEGLTVFLTDPDIPLDNNSAERSMRSSVLGRNNSVYSRSMNGARITGILYSIVQSCLMNGINPKQYMYDMVLAIRECRGILLPKAYADQKLAEATEVNQTS